MVILCAVYSMTNKLTHQLPLHNQTLSINQTGTLSTLPSHPVLTQYYELMGEMMKESKNPLYAKFFTWMIACSGDDNKRKVRESFMSNYVFPKERFEKIMAATPFPVPKKLEYVYAIFYDVERNLTLSSTNNSNTTPSFVFISAIYSFATILTHQTPINSAENPTTYYPEFFTTPSLPEMAEIFKVESKNPKYVPFFLWFSKIMGDEERRGERLPIMANYKYKGFRHILKTTPFAIPPRLEHMYALLWDVDRLLGEKKKSEVKAANPSLSRHDTHFSSSRENA